MLHVIGPAVLVRSASLALLACLALCAPALAGHEPSRLGLTPMGQSEQFFDLTLEPGESRQLKVEIANFGHDELLTRTYAADGYTIINGGFAAELFGEAASGTTLWLDYEQQELMLASGEGLVMDFSVSVPAGTPPGEYITALVAENAEPYRDAQPGSMTMEQVNRTVVAIAIDVPGRRHPALKIGGVSHKAAAGMSFVAFEIDNPGNVHLKPAGAFTLRDAASLPIANAEPVMDSVYARMDTLLEAPLAQILAPGDYCAELSLIDQATGAGDATTCLPFSVAAPLGQAITGNGSQTTPVVQPVLDAVGDDPLLAGLALLGGLAVMVVLCIVLWRRRRRRRLERTLPARPGY